MGRIIATLSGGLASGYVAMMALAQYPRADVTLYFNDTLWEDGDLYRFLADLERVLQHPVTRDSDGRDVEELAYYHNALPNDRMPFCSRTLKADRLQRYMRDGDTLLFGIGIDERHRASRIATRYSGEAQRRDMRVSVRFPLIEQGVTRDHIAAWYASVGIAQPALYGLGFKHNNCGGGLCAAGARRLGAAVSQAPGGIRGSRAARARDERAYRQAGVLQQAILAHSAAAATRGAARLDV